MLTAKNQCSLMHTQNCDKKQYLFPQLGGGITQPHVIQRSRILIFSSHNHKQWTRQVSGSMMHSFLRPFYWVTNRCANVDPVLEREANVEEVCQYTMFVETLILIMQEKERKAIVNFSACYPSSFCARDLNIKNWSFDIHAQSIVLSFNI